ncbi:hypothetical protein [Devosia sediminis]|uniref:Uncharacterized protein n=1 Tax=Devosia sediminis TaxID=2798801 RepID=A0A934MMR7_9HYPH|nr:hypothetical protein [Devosia sediminis]MBJ3785986.1 hypothetical protein [Devosia sediminis]
MQQSNHETRGTEKTVQGKQTREQQKAVIEGRENTKGAEVSADGKSLSEAREDVEQPAGEYEISHGDRSIRRGANQESEHHKRRDH